MKFFIYISICISLIIYAAGTPVRPQLWDYDGEYCIYSRDDVASGLISRRVNSGLGYIYYCDSANAAKLRRKFNNIDGESIVTTKDITVEEILRKFAMHKSSESFDGIYRTVTAGNKRYGTIQIAVRQNGIVIGFPVILGSY